jgi:hypothetical protein
VAHSATVYHWLTYSRELIVTIENLNKIFLEPSGWIRSQVEDAPLNANGKPLPWFTYGAIEFLRRVVCPTDHVFEYGAGFSTLWWQEKVDRVYSVEHDTKWCERLRPNLRSHVRLFNVDADQSVSPETITHVAPFFYRHRRTNWPYDKQKIIRRGLADDKFLTYAYHIVKLDKLFDFVVIDGMARRLCTFLAVNYIKPTGFIIFDNSNRSDYDIAYILLEEAGFRQIPFWGLAPGANFFTCTSFFTRSLERMPSCAFVGNSYDLPEF